MEFRVDTIKKVETGELWGICCMDAVGMVSDNHIDQSSCTNVFNLKKGLDLHDIKIIVQWGYTSSLSALMQRLGYGTRDPSLTAVGINLIELIYFDAYKGKHKSLI